MRKFRFLIALLGSLMPFNFVRILIYRYVFRYDIKNSKIGFGTIIDIKSFVVKDAKIGKFNLFTGPFSMKMQSDSSIGSGNIFRCGQWVVDNKSTHIEFKHHMHIGHNVIITNKHYFDVADMIEIGDNSWIAGYGSQFWTHGGEKADNNIVIGNDCYIGSAVRFAPGAQVSCNTIVALGSVVTKKFVQKNVMIAGSPAIVKKENFFWKKDLY